MSKPRSPARQALADAIADVGRARAAEAEADAAVSAMHAKVGAAQSTLSDAKAEALGAKRTLVERIKQAVLTGAAVPDTTLVAQARTKRLNAIYQMAGAKDALKIVEDAKARAVDTRQRADEALALAAKGVIAEDGLSILETAQKVEAEYFKLRLWLAFIRRHMDTSRNGPSADAFERINAFLGRGNMFAHEHSDSWRLDPRVTPWSAAFDALASDSDAPLPSSTR